MTSWTREQVLGLAPDAASAKAGTGLASASRWPLLGRTDAAAWGHCQGSGKKPYLTRVDLTEPAFKCSCPSRKFPCKHALGLMLLLSQDQIPAADAPPDWVSEWLDSRHERQQRKAARAETDAKREADPEARAKRAAKREQRVSDGLAIAEQWTLDLIEEGLAAARERPLAAWEQVASQLVDAQCPGLATMVRRTANACVSGDRWQYRTLDEVSRLFLAIQGAKRLDELPQSLQAEVRSQIGFVTPKEDVLRDSPRVHDTWVVAGRAYSDAGKVKAQRTWLWGIESGRPALILDFAAGSAVLDASLVPGMRFEGDCSFYPGSPELRALVADRGPTIPGGLPEEGMSLSSGVEGAAQLMGQGPWIDRAPFLATGVVPARLSEGWCLQDGDGGLVRLDAAEHSVWTLLALSGGYPVSVFGEWSEGVLTPLAAQQRDQFTVFTNQEAA